MGLPPTSLIVGYYPSIFNQYACYWMTGTLASLKARGDTQASCIALSGGKMYIAGKRIVDYVDVPCLWVDGTRADLPVFRD